MDNLRHRKKGDPCLGGEAFVNDQPAAFSALLAVRRSPMEQIKANTRAK
jgi:hypothetical protein